MTTPPPPSWPETKPTGLNRAVKALIALGIVAGVCLTTVVGLRVLGLIGPFSVPSGAMTPSVSPGDHVMMERLTFLARKPCRGDVVVFRTDGIASLPPATFFVKRVAGEPGERVRIADAKLYINDQPVALSNAVGKIQYLPPGTGAMVPPKTGVAVPNGQYYVLGDNSANSLDSRYWGCVPAKNIIGRVAFCYWPPERVGLVR